MVSSAPSNPSGIEHDTVVVGSSDGPAVRASELAPGTATGRYIVVETLGRGGMGEVVRAYDPKLRREVALKRVRPDRYGPEGEARLVREAQAMAQLSHPNVVAVYDVEVDADVVVLAMEYVPGQTLKRWLKDDPPSTEVLSAFLDAGRGLAAAHVAGLIHRDFKPSNVLVGDDGRVKVTDFGLAKPPGASESGHTHPETDPTVTSAGIVLGTPRYMAPEQHAGHDVDARADQYALCVAIWEALTGSAPFADDDLLAAKRRGPPPWPTRRELPNRVGEALRRGLAPQPADRWPSVSALLEALRVDDGTGRRWWRAGAGLAGIAAVAAVWYGARTVDAPCTAAPGQIAEVYDDSTRAAIRTAITGTPLPYAPQTAEWVARELDAYTQAWIDQHTAACEATSIRGEQSPAALDLRMACLGRARTSLAATVELLATADADVVERAEAVVAGLAPLDRCADIEALRADVPPPDDPAAAAEIDRVRGVVAEALALDAAGKHEPALALVDPLEETAKALDYPPLSVEVAMARGAVRRGLGRYQESESVLRGALADALAVGMNAAAARIAGQLASVVGTRLERVAEGKILADVAIALARSLDDEVSLAEAHNVAGSVARTAGDPREAARYHRLAIEAIEHAEGPDSPRLAAILGNLGNALQELAEYGEAEEILERALQRRRDRFGPEHPEVAIGHLNLGSLHYTAGDPERAEAQFRAALEIWEPLLPADHPKIAFTRSNLGTALEMQGRLDEAEQQMRAVLEIWERPSNPNKANTARALGNLAGILAHQGKLAEAKPMLLRAIALFEESLGPDHPTLIQAHSQLAEFLFRSGEHAEGLSHARKCLEMSIATHGPDHPWVGSAHHDLGIMLLQLDDDEAAVPHLEAAWAITRTLEGWKTATADTAFYLAMALRRTEGDAAKQRAGRLARFALATFADAGEAQAEMRGQVEQWLDDYGVPRDGPPVTEPPK